MEANYKKYLLHFKRPSGTSRGVLHQKETWFLSLKGPKGFGIGECGILRGLSPEDGSDYEGKLQWTCDNIHMGPEALWTALEDFPSIQFGVEQAFMSYSAANHLEPFPSEFTMASSPININGLIWMGDEAFMLKQLEEKLQDGFTCIKMKIGAIDFQSEIAILASLRKRYDKDALELRVDANGAFSTKDAMEKLRILAAYGLHSIEQPIPPGNPLKMAELCKSTPIPIALDEELIGVVKMAEKECLLEQLRPQFIILKPSLIGGFKGASQWIGLAEKYGIGWWITSALESNVGLNAIAQWTATLNNRLPQGLGTGSLYTNNIDSPLQVLGGQLYYRTDKMWDRQKLQGICL
ncbi:MAG: o-succinylbenzoate synthase [Sediminicola sp.]